ncbi:MAG: hypothetical protein IPG66_08695 [Hydrogenophilales bacterium]|nr:hypothetical protein [Hydrogenophilales bacterium]
MSNTSGAYRWWENYLVRYLMPSIAGAVIVNWLATAAGLEFRKILLLDVGVASVQTPTLFLLFLYGNLFCYISSYPILGFHVTRVIDFERGALRKGFFDGYIVTAMLALVTLILTSVCFEPSAKAGIIAPFLFVTVYVAIQLYRIRAALDQVSFNGLNGKTSKVFAYSYAISKRRGVVEEVSVTKQLSKDQVDGDTGDKFDEESEWHKKSIWRREFIDTYRHMREHGNSAFIFILELTLAGLCFLVLVAYKNEGAVYQLAAIGLLLAIWAIPAMFIHFVGQHIERRFSWYDRKVSLPTEANQSDL